jgi:hypothetical protein
VCTKLISSDLLCTYQPDLLHWSKELADHIKDNQAITYTGITMDLLKSLIVPPVYSSTPRDTLSRDPRLFCCTTSDSDQIPSEHSSLDLTEPAAHQPAQQKSASASTKRTKRKNQKHKQKQILTEQNSVATAAVQPAPATITKVQKRKHGYLFHPDRPKSGANKKLLVSYEDLYDEIADQAPTLPPSDSHASKSNPEATQTCFFWYHGSCKRSLDRKGCQLRHALLDPPQMVVAPPRFVHPKPCELQWCAGDGPTHKGQKVKSGAEQKRYFEINVSDDGPARDGADQDAGDECFLRGFEEPDDT